MSPLKNHRRGSYGEIAGGDELGRFGSWPPFADHDCPSLDSAKLRGQEGHLHEPSTKPTMKPESRDTLLTVIAKARGWIDDIRLGRIASFARIAERGGRGRTAHPPARSPRLAVAPHHRGGRRRHRTYGSHGHRSRQSPAPFLGRARAEDRASPRSTKRSINATWPARGAALEIRQKRLRWPSIFRRNEPVSARNFPISVSAWRRPV
jgi:hypothetical protein